LTVDVRSTNISRVTQTHFGMQLPIQALSRLIAEEWEFSAGPSELKSVAQAADRAGFDYIGVCDHVAIPRDLAPRMTTTWYDTVSTLSWLAGVTERVRLASTVYVVAYRNPLLTAKSFATLDYLSGGRAILGVGAGHVAAEFGALGVPFNRRGRMTNNYILAIRDAFADEWGSGDFGQSPRPVQPGGPPIWIGGSTPAAFRRAAELGDGWLPQGPPALGMEATISEIHRLREAAGRADRPFAINGSARLYIGEPSWEVGPCVTGKPEAVAEAIEVQRRIGATHVQLRIPSRSADELIDQITAFGADVVPLLD
jgi:probable F420-dependent oxidoreductase